MKQKRKDYQSSVFYSLNGERERQIQYLTAAVIGYEQGGLEGAMWGMIAVDRTKPKASWETYAMSPFLKRSRHYDSFDALADVAKGFQRILHDINNFNDCALQKGAKWMSGGAQRAADTVNLFTFGRRHNENSLSHKISRSDLGEMYSRNKACADLTIFGGGGIATGASEAIKQGIINSTLSQQAIVAYSTNPGTVAILAGTFKVIVVVVAAAMTAQSIYECGKSIKHL